VLTARHRRRATDQRLAERAAQFGFATLRGYLADRLVQQGWPLRRIADQLGVDVRTLRDRLQRFDLYRGQASIR
jgi:DNA-binding NtrC family response regulator